MANKKNINVSSVLIRSVLSICFIFIFLLILLHLPYVQTKIINGIIGPLTSSVHGKITIESAKANIYEGVTLNGITLIDDRLDTLLHIDAARVSPRNTLITLITRDIALHDILMKGVDIKVFYARDESVSNWHRFIGNQKEEPASRKGKTPDISLIRLNDLKIEWIDERSNEYILATLIALEVDINSIDLSEQPEIDVDRILLNGPSVTYQIGVRPEQTTTQDSSLITLSQEESVQGGFPHIKAKDIFVENGRFLVIRENEEHLEASNLDLNIHDLLLMDKDEWSLVLEEISGETKKDQVPYASIGKIERKGGDVIIEKAAINLNNSKLKFNGSIHKVAGFADVSDASYKLNMLPSILYVKDLFTFLPDLAVQLKQDPIASKRLQLEGDFKIDGRKYVGEKISIWLNGLHHFEGNISFNQSTPIAQSLLNATIKRLHTDMNDLAHLSSAFNIPEELLRLKTIDFSGSFDGYLNDFVANGLLVSPLGKANMDIKFDLSGVHNEAVSYDGFLALDSFDLHGLTLNSDFGIIDAQINITEGRGPDLSSSSAKLKAVIDKLEFKNFVYQNAIYEGELSSKVVDGKFEIHDDQLDFEFEGIVDFTDRIPVFDFKIFANKINFCQLNITTFPCELAFSSDINLTGNSLNNIQGSADIMNIKLKHDTATFEMDKIAILSIPGLEANHFTLTSDYIDFDIEGRFNLLNVIQQSVAQIVSNVEAHNEVWNLKIAEKDSVKQEFNYSILLKDATPLFHFLQLNIDQKGFASFAGNHNSEKNGISLKAFIPFLSYNDISADSIDISLDSEAGSALVDLKLKNITRSTFQLKELNVSSDFRDRFSDWAISYDYDDYNKSMLVANSEVRDKGYFTKFIDDNVLIDSTKWKILSKEGIGIFPGKIDIEEFTLSDGTHYVSLKDIANKGLEIAINDFELDFINPIINYDKTIFTGSIKSRIKIENVFDDRALQGFVDVADFKINGDDFGHLLLKAQRSIDNNNVIDLDLSIKKDTQNLFAWGYYDIDSSYMNVDLNLEDYPMSFFEYIIEDGISETIGTTDIRAKIFGPLAKLKMNGTALVKNSGVKVNYLGAFYRMENQSVKLDEKFIDFNGVELIDEMGNTATITGGLRHNLLADIRADLSISSPRFIGLNTTDQDNPLYYGLGVGKIDISFKGPFDAINIVVAARLDHLSKLSIPLNSTSYIYDESFIVFTNTKDTAETSDPESLAELLKEKGVDFEMSLTFTPDAVVSIIYDEVTGNILEGTGEGNLQINVKRDGEFTAYGSYNILTGKYLYTAYGFIAKQFVIRNGGSVIWTGDPLNATLDVSAEYPQLRAPLQNFLSEFQGTPGVTEQALSIRRDVDLTLILTGPLFNPNINFDIDFPDLTGNLRTYAQNKVRVLRATENGINNQVVGLLVFRDFLPDNNGLAAISQSDVGQTGTNTITQFLTSQLSLLFSDYLSSKLGDNNILSGIDFEIAVAQNSILADDANLFQGLIDVVPDEFQLNLRNRFKNENFVLNLGGNYVRENQLTQAQNYVTGDFSLDWYITEDRRLKLRFYGNYDYDDAFSTRRQRYGFGINYRKEFGSLTVNGFQQVLEEMIREIQKESATTGSID